jgi:hypothetical protein
MIEHGGGINGFRCYATRMPEDHIFVAVLSNLQSYSPELLALKLSAAAMGEPYSEPARINLSPEVLARFDGVYEYDALVKVSVTSEGQCLFAQFNQEPRFELIPIAPNQFMLEPQRLTRITFIDDGEREAGAFEIEGRYGIPRACKRVDSAAGTSL